MLPGKAYSIIANHRPKRVAFLVDIDQLPATIDVICDFNCDHWGGRFNPIIPVQGGVICESYWPLLRLADPDTFYSFCDITASDYNKIDREIGPLEYLEH